jgi:hypothetical protein
MSMFGAMPAISGGLVDPRRHLPMPIPGDQPKKAGMFGAGKGNIGEIIGALLSGFSAAQGNPAGQMGLQMLHQRRQQAMQEQQHQQRRGEDFEDFVKKQAWEIANKPQAQRQPHYFEDNAGNLMAVGPDGKPQMVHKDPLQWKLVPNGLGGVVPINISALGQGQQQPLPQTLSDEDWQAQGGPTPQASGGFPGPY